MLRLGGIIILGEALLRLGGPESAENLGSGSPRRSNLRLGLACTPMPRRKGIVLNA